MRVAVVTSIHPVLDKRIYERQCRILAQAGYEVHLIAPGAPKGPVAEGITFHSFRGASGRIGRFKAHAALKAHVRAVRPDVVHFHDPDLLFAVGDFLQDGDPVVIYDAHEDFPLASRTSLGLPLGLNIGASLVVDGIERLAARRVDGVICAHRRRLAQLRPGSDGLYFPNYPSKRAFIQAESSSRDRSCLYLGLLQWDRGAEALLLGAKLAPDIRWLVVGDFPTMQDRDRFLARVRTESLHNLEWIGQVPYERVPLLLATAGVGVMPWLATPQHQWASQPTKLYEYLAAGLPVVASRLQITEEVVGRSKAGLLHTAGDAHGMVASVRRILDDQTMALSAGRAGRAAFLAEFNLERIAPQFLQFYQRLIETKRRSRGRARMPPPIGS